MTSIDINTILQIASLVVMTIGGFWFKMMLNRIETRQSKEVCGILMAQNEKDHNCIKADVDNVGAKVRTAHKEG